MGRPRKDGPRYPGGKLKPDKASKSLAIDVGEIRAMLPLAGTAIYVMVAGGATKIGISDDPARRCAAMQTGQDRDIAIHWAARMPRGDARKLEQAVHIALRRTSTHKRGEWYYIDGVTAVAVIKDHLDRLGITARTDFEFGFDRDRPPT